MLWRVTVAILVGLWWCAVPKPALAAITDPFLGDIAQAYDKALPEPPAMAPADIVRSLNQARKAGDAAEALRLSEALVALGRDNGQAWLALSRTWLAQDGGASNGLAAAIRATQTARTQGDRAEALLLASAFLRNRLDQARARHDAARAAIARTEASIIQMQELGKQADFVAPDPDDGAGRLQSLQSALGEAAALAGAAADEVGRLAAALDDVYGELQSSLPGVDETVLQDADARLAFDLVSAQAQDEEEDGDYSFFSPRVAIHVEGDEVRACVTFSAPLKDDHLDYTDFVEISGDDDAPSDGYGVHASGDQLCILRLEPGAVYDVVILAGLTSADGRPLDEDREFSIDVPDLPARVGFGDGEFILPGGGPGALPVYLTNIETEIPLFLHRISDRTLYRHLALGHVRNGIPNREHRDLIGRFSETLWRGYGLRPLAPQERNRTLRSFVPVRTILEDRARWLADAGWNDRQGGTELESEELPVPRASDDFLSMKGRFVGDAFAAQGEKDGRLQPGVHVLVAGVREEAGTQAHDRYCQDDGDNCQVFTTQWFVITDIGLTFYEGERDFTVIARSLETGGPVADARIELVTQGNKVLAEQSTDQNGVARFDRGLTGGHGSNALVAVLAHTQDDFSFIKYGSERLDLSRLNVGGHDDQQGSGAALYTDRGIYQPGETIRALALMRQRTAAAGANAELRLRISDYTVASQPVGPAEWRDGGALAGLRIPEAARPGAALLSLVSPAGDELAAQQIDIGRIRPDRARLRFDADSLAVSLGASGLALIEGRASAQYLYGAEGTGQAPASGLKAELAVRVQPARSPVAGCYDGFDFGAFDDTVLPVISRNFVDFTDAQGMLRFSLAGIRLPETTRPLVAVVELTLFDAAGAIASSQTQIAIPARQLALGVSSMPRLVVADDGYRLGLDLVAIGADGKAAAGSEVEIRLEHEQEFYVWENVDGTWQHVRTRQRSPVSTTTAQLTPAANGDDGCAAAMRVDNVAEGVPDGRYVVTVTEPSSGATASARFNTGISQTSADDLEPNIFVLTAGKERYAPGETVELSVDAPFDSGEVLVAIAGRDIETWHVAPVRDRKASISFAAGQQLAGKGWYALATAFKADAASSSHLGPARAIGAAYFEVSDDQSGFEVAIKRQQAGLDDFLRPHEPLVFDVCVSGAGGECVGNFAGTVHAAAFVVDEGLLSLTGHEAKAEAMERSFVGREALKLRVMDNYGRLLLTGGGDLPGRLALSNYTSNRIVAAAQGPVTLQGGRATFTFDDPGLNAGSLKIYVVAWSDGHVASARESVPVRQFLVSNLGLSDFFLAGDSPLLPLRLENISFAGHQGDYALSFAAEGGIGVSLLRGDGSRVEPGADGSFAVAIPPGEPQDLLLALDLPTALSGRHTLTLNISASGAPVDLPKEERERSWELDLRGAGVEVQRYLSFPLGERPVDLALLLGAELADYDPASVRIKAHFASDESLLRLASLGADASDDAGLLDRMVWDGFIHLGHKGLAGDEAARARVQHDIDNVLALQLPDGAFVPYRTDGEFVAAELGFDTKSARSMVRHGLMRTASALDFLTRARRAGYAVPPASMTNALAYIDARVSDAQSYFYVEDDPALVCLFETRYAMLLLVQAGRFDRSKLEDLEQCGDDGLDTPSFSELVNTAVFTQYGEATDAKAVLASYYDDAADYLEDLDPYRKAIAISMLADSGADAGLVRSIARSYLDDGIPSADLRTRAWLARAAADLGGPAAELSADDLEVGRPDLLALQTRPDGVVESREFGFAELEGAELDGAEATVALGGPAQGRAYLRVSGVLREGGDLALPQEVMRQRFFHADTGQEFDPRQTAPEVGDTIVVVVEAAAGALENFTDDDFSDVGMNYGPVVVDVAMPGALAIISDRLQPPPPDSDLAQLQLYGNLRSVASHVQHWRGVIVPESARGDAEQPNRDNPNTTRAAPFEFRQGFVTRVTAAGSFVFPSSVVDALDSPGNTLLSQPVAFSVAVPGAGAQ